MDGSLTISIVPCEKSRVSLSPFITLGRVELLSFENRQLHVM